MINSVMYKKCNSLNVHFAPYYGHDSSAYTVFRIGGKSLCTLVMPLGDDLFIQKINDDGEYFIGSLDAIVNTDTHQLSFKLQCMNGLTDNIVLFIMKKINKSVTLNHAKNGILSMFRLYHVIDTRPFYILTFMIIENIHIRKDESTFMKVTDSLSDVIIRCC